MNTIENNKLIAEFMGAFALDIEEEDGFWYLTDGLFPHGYDRICFGAMKYASDWNWLMEVVDKIESLNVQKLSFNFNIQKDRVSLYYAHISEPKKQIEMYFEWGQKTKIENLNKIVVEFIKWYNEQKKLK